MFLQFLFVDAINRRITNYCTSTRRPMNLVFVLNIGYLPFLDGIPYTDENI